MGKTKTKSYALVSAANYSLVTMTAWSRVIDVRNSHVLNAWGCRKSNTNSWDRFGALYSATTVGR